MMEGGTRRLDRDQRIREGSRRPIEKESAGKGPTRAEQGDPRGVTVSDPSWSIQPSLASGQDQSGHPVGSRSVVDLLGRSDEVELIEALLAGRGPAGSGLLLRGDPGVGKTALLDVAAARAQVRWR